jgi:hypothetical protein
VEAETALVRAQHGRELDAVAAVHLHASGVVDPRDAEHDLPLGLDDALGDARVDEPGLAVQYRRDRLQHLVDGLLEFGSCGFRSVTVS